MIKIKFIFLLMFACILLCLNSPPCQASDHIIKFGTLNDPDTKLYKLALAILTEAFSRNGYRFSLEYLPGSRSLEWANTGELDGDAFRISNLNKSNNFPHLIKVEEPIFTIDQCVWSKLDIEVKGWDSLKQYNVVYDRGTKFIEEKVDIFRSAQAVKDMNQVFHFLNAGRADLTIASLETGTIYLKKLNLEKSGIKALSPPLKFLHLYPYMNRQHHTQLALKLAETLRSMKSDGSFQIITNDVQKRYELKN